MAIRRRVARGPGAGEGRDLPGKAAMSQNTDRNELPGMPARRRRAGASAGALTVLFVILYAGALGVSVAMVYRNHFELGVLGVLLVLTLAPVGFVLLGFLHKSGPGSLEQRIEELARAVRVLGDHASLSDDARRVLNRQSERELLCSAIEEDITGENWDAAMVLIKELADAFGYRADAERFRRRVEEARHATQQREITDAIGYLDGLILQRRWDAAYADSERLLRLFPDARQVFGLRARVDQAYRTYRDELERRFLEAAKEGRADEAMSLLKELDSYLSSDEAEPLRELAKGVISKARDNLGAQFKIAVKDRRWQDAVRHGEAIIADFPNTRMAAEVRNVIDGIRMRAGATA